MKKIFYWTLGAALFAGAALLATNQQQTGELQSSDAAMMNSAAFRDGAYMGQLAAQRGESSRIAIGRWARQSDRDAFAAGYTRGYAQNLLPATAAERATNAAFRDGLYLGKLDAASGKEQHIASGRWARNEDRSSFTSGYQQAYQETLVAMR